LLTVGDDVRITLVNNSVEMEFSAAETAQLLTVNLVNIGKKTNERLACGSLGN
jgi:hypothetical protein